MPEPPAWGNRNLPGFEKDIQPIFDRNCAKCHGAEEPAGGKELTARRFGDYLQSYRTLFGVKPDEVLPVSSEDAWRWIYPDKPAPPVDKEWYQKIEKNEADGQLILNDLEDPGAVEQKLRSEFESSAAHLRAALRVLLTESLDR